MFKIRNPFKKPDKHADALRGKASSGYLDDRERAAMFSAARKAADRARQR